MPEDRHDSDVAGLVSELLDRRGAKANRDVLPTCWRRHSISPTECPAGST